MCVCVCVPQKEKFVWQFPPLISGLAPKRQVKRSLDSLDSLDSLAIKKRI